MQTGEAEDDTADEGDVHWQTGAAAFEAGAGPACRPRRSDCPRADGCRPALAPGTWPEPLPMPEPTSPRPSQAFRYRPSRLPYFETGEAA